MGATREETRAVGDENAITFLGPEGPRVLSTPRMIGYMEGAARNLILDMLEAGHDTVGTHVNVSHCAAAPMGAAVTFFAELTGVQRNRATFNVKATMGDKTIGEGTHERAIIDVRRFRQKVEG
ncbi:MAG: thioesterase family protein [Acidobacteriota bacterium]|nr:thioesterase family protein [Acidobacteriota bacterium]